MSIQRTNNPVAPPASSGGSMTGTNASNTPGVSTSNVPTMVINAPTPQALPTPPQAPTPQVNNAPSQTPGPNTNPTNSTSTTSTPPNSTTTSSSAPAPTAPTMSPADVQKALDDLFNSVNYPNPLNSFYQVAYHWRLFIISDVDVYKKANSGSSGTGSNVTPQAQNNALNSFYNAIENDPSMVVIAESGVTTYNIKSVESRALVGPNNESRNSYVTNFTIQIAEPMGIGFLDAMKEAALSIQVNNLQKCPYYLELSFKGYNEDGTIATDALSAQASAGTLECSRWIWQIMIIDIDTHFDAGGGNYTIRAQVYNDGSLEQDILRVPQVTTVTGGTIGAVLQNLGKNLSDGWQKRYGTDIVKYDFTMHEITNPPPAIAGNTNPNTYSMNGDHPNQNPQKIAPMNQASPTDVRPQWAAGTAWTDIIDWIMNNNEQTQNLGLDRDGAKTKIDNSTSSTNDRKMKESIIMRVETDIELGDYDVISANYRKIVHVHIWPYYTQCIIASPTQRDDARDPAVQGTMLSRLLQLSYIRKHYDYLYTGKNTEVLEFDIKSCFVWNALLPKLDGARSGYANYTPPAVVTPANLQPQGNLIETNSDLMNLVTQRKNDIQALAKTSTDLENKNSILNGQIQQMTLDRTAALNVLQQSTQPGNTVTSEQKANALQTLQKINGGTSDNLVSLQAQQNSLLQQIQVAHNQATQLNQANQQDITSFNNRTGNAPKHVRYAEDLIGPDGSSINQTANEDYINFNFNISFRQGDKDAAAQAGTGFDGMFHRDRSVFGALIEQLYQPYTTQLSNVDLTIRGDPFWIGMSNLHRMLKLRSTGGTTSTTPNSGNAGTQDCTPTLPNWVSGDQVFLLSFRYPVKIAEDGSPVFRSDETFNGCYRATEILSTFSEGKFTQKIHGVIVPLLNTKIAVANLKGLPTGTNQKPAQSQPTQPPTNQNYPAVKQRLTSAQQQANAAAFKAALLKYGANLNPPMTSVMADGIVANAYRESGMDPTAVQRDANGNPTANPGLGLVQITNPNQVAAFTNTIGVPPNQATIDQQAQYIVMQLGGQVPTYGGLNYNEVAAYQGGSRGPGLASATDVNSATANFLRSYERGPSQNFNSNLSKSLSYTQNLYGNQPGNS